MTPAMLDQLAELVVVSDPDAGTTVAGHVRVAGAFGERFLGLMGRRSLEAGEGLLLVECRSVHTCFMRFPIDVAYLDRDMRVVATHNSVGPWRFLPGAPGGRNTLELAAGTLDRRGVKAGHKLEFRSTA